jgi:large subunit ribosomal protein L18
MKIKTTKDRRERIRLRQRKRISGTAERPRLAVFRSVTHIYAQVIDDSAGATLVAVSTLTPGIRGAVEGDKREEAKRIGEEIAKKCLAANIQKVVFDRNGFIYTGRVAALAEGARAGGLQF